MTLTPNLTAGIPNPNVGYNNAWIPVTNDQNRSLFAEAVFLTNATDFSSPISSGINSQLGQSGFVFLTGGQTATGTNFSTVQIVSAAKISSITATNSTIGSLTQIELPTGLSFNGPIQSITLSYGAAFVYKL